VAFVRTALADAELLLAVPAILVRDAAFLKVQDVWNTNRLFLGRMRARGIDHVRRHAPDPARRPEISTVKKWLVIVPTEEPKTPSTFSLLQKRLPARRRLVDPLEEGFGL
jgi:hypothetical protein